MGLNEKLFFPVEFFSRVVELFKYGLFQFCVILLAIINVVAMKNDKLIS